MLLPFPRLVLPASKRAIRFGQSLQVVGIAGLAILGLTCHDFVLKWQPVPSWLPLRELMAFISNLVLLTCGVGLMIPRTKAATAIALSLYLLSWAVILHCPIVLAHPTNMSAWGYMSGILAVAAGPLTLWTTLSERHNATSESASIATNVRKLGRLLLALPLLEYGVGHLLFAHGLTSLVPGWLPWRTGIVYFTGFAHIAAGLGLLFGFLPRTAATLEAVMMSSFVLLVDLPHSVIMRTRQPLTALCFETALVGAVWIVSGSLSLGSRLDVIERLADS
jgi:uncharacterized membrane protein